MLLACSWIIEGYKGCRGRQWRRDAISPIVWRVYVGIHPIPSVPPSLYSEGWVLGTYPGRLQSEDNLRGFLINLLILHRTPSYWALRVLWPSFISWASQSLVGHPMDPRLGRTRYSHARHPLGMPSSVAPECLLESKTRGETQSSKSYATAVEGYVSENILL